jgi:CRISPR-associated Csx2 family protein
MSRKIFLSFLGATPYHDTAYYFPKQENTALAHYVQEPILRHLAAKGLVMDEVYIFTTPEALQYNYRNAIKSIDFKTKQPVVVENTGLASRLQILQDEGLLQHFEYKMIANGANEKEVWTIFQTVFQCLQAGDEVYFDITFGFRSLPMLGIVLLHYANVVENAIEMKAIYYGNYEAGRAVQDEEIRLAVENKSDESALEALRKTPIAAPILDFISFAELQKWTLGAHTFLKLGNATDLGTLIKPNNTGLAENLVRLNQAVLTCRGSELIKDIDIQQIRNELIAESEKLDIKAQLLPLIEKINAKLKPFENETVENGFAAVEWCIQHGWVQQGYTFLQETVISYIITQIIGIEKINNVMIRNGVNAILNHTKENKWKDDADFIAAARVTLQFFKDNKPKSSELKKYYGKLTGATGLRNDISHCGYNDNGNTSEMLTADLRDIATKIKDNLF